MSLVPQIIEGISRLPWGAIQALWQLVQEALSSEDPERIIRRGLIADASHEGTKVTVNAALKEQSKR
ncbi:MAG TPA: hypothetical protein VHO25_22330 [Polyangiaceae bacterium]|nr:hypothetical protein [Polyangiaceae bacterium]